MIYTMRTFHVDRKDYAEFVKISQENIWPKIEKEGAKVIGLWVVVMGGPERILLLTRYDSLAHWEETRGWSKSVLMSPAGGRAALVKDTGMIALSAVSKREPTNFYTGDNPGIYTMRTFDVRANDVDRLVDLSENYWWLWAEPQLRHYPIGQFLSTIAPEQNRIYMITRYDDMAHWENTRGPVPEPEDPELRKIWADAYRAVRERRQMVLGTQLKVLRPISERLPTI